MILVFDTETTGKADFKAHYSDEKQPYLVQLAALLFDTKFELQAGLDCIVKPVGFEIPKVASDIHGITQELALANGINISPVLALFKEFCAKATTIVAHNLKFDSLILAAARHRSQLKEPFQSLGCCQFCTMEAMTPIMKLPGQYGFKWPRLDEAYRYCFGKDFSGAHNALHDVRACAEIYQWLKNKEPIST